MLKRCHLQHTSNESGLQEAQQSAQLQMQQYVVDIQALERNGDALARELQSAKSEAEDLARDRNRIVEQLQAAQVCPMPPKPDTCTWMRHARFAVTTSVLQSCLPLLRIALCSCSPQLRLAPAHRPDVCHRL